MPLDLSESMDDSDLAIDFLIRRGYQIYQIYFYARGDLGP